MRILLACLALLTAAAPAGAISRYNAWTISCADAKDLIRAEGAIILRFRSILNPSLPRFGRFVYHDGFCTPSEYADYSYIPTADAKSCPVRECRDIDHEDEFRLLKRFR
ncbi:hypothetical protein SAZ10_11540 [Mesorhizobium sp. BAC0120]|uniref:hypothetical protein n=1 Tax=Mesorhizobium sp. BAC0120 TaxID=3090670 RepID=UPI00298D1EB5|nr:hypothetical protein [Mesorhizobium sp. BAC0120]MDW6022387.1 hypothetical protein [Mesorhizobium sp. BAC0120]